MEEEAVPTIEELLKSPKLETDVPQPVAGNLKHHLVLNEKEKPVYDRVVARSEAFLSKAQQHNPADDETLLRDLRIDLRNCLKYSEKKMNLVTEAEVVIVEAAHKLDEEIRKLQKEQSREEEDDKKKKQAVQKKPRKSYAHLNEEEFVSPQDEELYAPIEYEEQTPSHAHSRKHHQAAVPTPVPAAAPYYEFCLCHREMPEEVIMIGCDNERCESGQWFHLACVGLTAPPDEKTKWYCPGCVVARFGSAADHESTPSHRGRKKRAQY